MTDRWRKECAATNLDIMHLISVPLESLPEEIGRLSTAYRHLMAGLSIGSSGGNLSRVSVAAAGILLKRLILLSWNNFGSWCGLVDKRHGCSLCVYIYVSCVMLVYCCFLVPFKFSYLNSTVYFWDYCRSFHTKYTFSY